ncbi:O-antigen polymerase [Acinetobacter towneri]|uniref:O-antigen polymerase n=1 Tax=Acinetobacter towneri TaxID=202956 RepID=UPI001F607530|nr:O-antigen polymerase [Acinetobacter towneri]UNT61965.1 oligosaccharide repeat unit polymerase [Acinetobacter towneri]
MFVKKSDFLVLILISFFSFLGLNLDSTFISIIIFLVIYFFIGYLVEEKSSIHMMFFVGFSTFIFLPALLNWYYLKVNFSLFFLSSIASSFFIFFTKKTIFKSFLGDNYIIKYIYMFLCFILVFLCLLGIDILFSSMVAPLIILLSLCFKQNDIKNNLFFTSIFIITFFVYVIFSWGGFGRTVVFGWLLVALLQFCYSIGFILNKYFFALLPSLAASLMSSRDFFNLKFNGFESSLNDSAYSPYRLSSTFIDQFNENGFNFLGFFDQILFTLFVFIPRSIWSDKPFGFGYEYTVQNSEQYLVDAGHSIASTLIGDHIYYLGYLGIISSVIVLLLIAFLTNLLYRLPGLNGNGVLIFSSSMMVLVWGGMTSFSARIALPSIMFLLIYFLLRRFLINRTKIRFGL